MNKIFLTFSDDIENTISQILNKYSEIHNIFILKQDNNSPEFIITYNLQVANILPEHILKNTILVHRKQHSNTLYTINGLNYLIKSLNNGILDKTFIINWNDYKNMVILSENNTVKKINTTLYEKRDF